ncbi:MAG: hypothetical protein K2X81_08260 [Candidatus Obscuribacterales bacterium]|nr:hypothetical protein [Candidatus Obscuribacterales bacterium]
MADQIETTDRADAKAQVNSETVNALDLLKSNSPSLTNKELSAARKDEASSIEFTNPYKHRDNGGSVGDADQAKSGRGAPASGREGDSSSSSNTPKTNSGSDRSAPAAGSVPADSQQQSKNPTKVDLSHDNPDMSVQKNVDSAHPETSLILHH